MALSFDKMSPRKPIATENSPPNPKRFEYNNPIPRISTKHEHQRNILFNKSIGRTCDLFNLNKN